MTRRNCPEMPQAIWPTSLGLAVWGKSSAVYGQSATNPALFEAQIDKLGIVEIYKRECWLCMHARLYGRRLSDCFQRSSFIWQRNGFQGKEKAHVEGVLLLRK